MFLSQLPWEYLQVGFKVIGAQGTSGKITSKDNILRGDENNWLTVTWENGNISQNEHLAFDKVTIDEPFPVYTIWVERGWPANTNRAMFVDKALADAECQKIGYGWSVITETAIQIGDDIFFKTPHKLWLEERPGNGWPEV